jgi:hypothetical protein
MTDDDKIALTAEVKRCNERLDLIDQDDHLRSGADSIRTVEILLSLRDQVGAIRDQIGLLIEMLPDTWEEGALYNATHLLQKRAEFIKARLNQEAVDYLDARTVNSLELNAGDLDNGPDKIDFEFGELSAEALRKLEELPPTGPVTDDEINEVTQLMEAQAVAAEQFGHFWPVLKRNNWGFLEGGMIAQAREEKFVDSTVTELRALENRAEATRADWWIRWLDCERRKIRFVEGEFNESVRRSEPAKVLTQSGIGELVQSKQNFLISVKIDEAIFQVQNKIKQARISLKQMLPDLHQRFNPRR